MQNNRAVSLITLAILIAIFALLLRIAIVQVIKITINQNESSALSTLKLISTALENYAKDNQGIFPLSLISLSQTKPPYLDKDYISQLPIRGYNYNCSRLEQSGYSCFAVPVKCNITAKRIFTVTTGGALTYEDCSKKE